VPLLALLPRAALLIAWPPRLVPDHGQDLGRARRCWPASCSAAPACSGLVVTGRQRLSVSVDRPSPAGFGMALTMQAARVVIEAAPAGPELDRPSGRRQRGSRSRLVRGFRSSAPWSRHVAGSFVHLPCLHHIV